MKRLFSILIAVFATAILIGQVPESFNYQAVLRDASGNIRANTDVSIDIAILQGSATGTQVFSEAHSTSTNEFGLVNLEIGSINSTSFQTIDWEAGPYFVKVSVDETDMGTSQLLSVPYALHSKTATNSSKLNEENSSFYRDASNINAGTLNTDYYSAYGDLNEEGYLDNNSGTDILTRDQADDRYDRKIAFLAYKSTNQNVTQTSWVDVPMEIELFDLGNAYNNSTGVFTAPLNGVYHFTIKVSLYGANATNGYMIVGYRMNGESPIKLELRNISNTTSHEECLEGSITLKLSAGNTIQSAFYSSPDDNYTLFSGLYHTTFCGHLVFSE